MKKANVCDNWPDTPGAITELDNIGPPRWNVAFETLSDDVLIEIFDLYLDKDENMDPWYAPDNEEDERHSYDAWYALVHVCQRWRYVVFESPRRLNLRLHCSRRRVREMLDVWPAALPIVIWDIVDLTSDEDNIIAALEHRDRVCEIKLGDLTILQLEKLVPFMQEPFPALAKLQIESYPRIRDELLVFPDSFLGGSAPHLRFLYLASISFPAFPNLLRSASNLVYLYLHGIPSGYISSEMVAALSALTKLEDMRLIFRYPDPDSDSDLEDRAPPSLTRSVLPALKGLELRGDGEYLDDFVTRIDVPSINYLKIQFTNQPFFVKDFFHLPQFIGRVEKFRSFDYAYFDFSPHAMDVTLSPQGWTLPGALQLNFLCDTDDPLTSLVEAFNTFLLPLSNIKTLQFSVSYSYRDSQSIFKTEDPQWLEVLRQFSGAKSLYLGSMGFVPPVALALKQVIDEGMTDVLPAIQELTVSGSLSAGPVREAIEEFATARGLSAFGTRADSTWWVSVRDTTEG